MAKCKKPKVKKPQTDQSKITDDHAFIFNKVADMVHQVARDHGWHPRNKREEVYIAESCSNLHGEVSELWEAHRKGHLTWLCDKAEEMSKQGITPLTCEEEELADIIIRALDVSAHLGIDIGGAIAKKHAFNRTRPHRHGGKKA